MSIAPLTGSNATRYGDPGGTIGELGLLYRQERMKGSVSINRYVESESLTLLLMAFLPASVKTEWSSRSTPAAKSVHSYLPHAHRHG